MITHGFDEMKLEEITSNRQGQNNLVVGGWIPQ
jgi:hypothetical protein